MEQLKRAKEEFILKYNPKRDLDKALKLSIKASVQRNPTYTQHLSSNSDERKQVRLYWQYKLKEYAEKYKGNVSMDDYVKDVLLLKEEINFKFKEHFNHPNYINDNGFRIAHAQKSLKHLWCLDLVNEPPMCPIDNIILTKIGLKYPLNKWGYINSVEDFKNKAGLVLKESESKGLTVCEWELINFS